jgi:hypothetical protein
MLPRLTALVAINFISVLPKALVSAAKEADKSFQQISRIGVSFESLPQVLKRVIQKRISCQRFPHL